MKRKKTVTNSDVMATRLSGARWGVEDARERARKTQPLTEGAKAWEVMSPAERRKWRYRNDPDYQAKVKASNRRYLRERRSHEPTREEIFDTMLAEMKKKWKADAKGMAK